MSAERIRVVLAIPVCRRIYGEAGGRAAAKVVRRVGKIAERLGPGQGLDVVLYGRAARDFEDRVVRTRIEPGKDADAWEADWGAAPNAQRRVIEDPLPPNRLESAFTADPPPRSVDCLPLVRAVDEWAPRAGGDTLVICWAIDPGDVDEVARSIHAGGREDVFWQFFSDIRTAGVKQWRRDGLSEGRLLPNVMFRFSEWWSPWGITRGFRRWRRRRLG